MSKRINELIERIGGMQLSSRDTVAASYLIAKSAIEQGIPGDFVECGVYAGVQSAMMAYGMIDCGETMNRRVHLFDTFAGIPAGGPEDTNWTHPAGTSACSLEQVQRNMAIWCVPSGIVSYHAGLVEDTVPLFAESMKADGRRIAVLRIDVDLYEPTKCVLEHLRPLVSPGGWIIADDFGLPGARKAILDHIGSEPVYWRHRVY